MPTKTSATITIKAATMMSIIIAPSTTECGDQSADGEEDAKSQGYHNNNSPDSRCFDLDQLHAARRSRLNGDGSLPTPEVLGH